MILYDIVILWQKMYNIVYLWQYMIDSVRILLLWCVWDIPPPPPCHPLVYPSPPYMSAFLTMCKISMCSFWKIFIFQSKREDGVGGGFPFGNWHASLLGCFFLLVFSGGTSAGFCSVRKEKRWVSKLYYTEKVFSYTKKLAKGGSVFTHDTPKTFKNLKNPIIYPFLYI